MTPGSIADMNTLPPISALPRRSSPTTKNWRRANEELTSLLANNKSTIPSLLGAEKKENVFLRADVPAVAAAVGLSGHSPAEVFAEVRARKNKF